MERTFILGSETWVRVRDFSIFLFFPNNLVNSWVKKENSSYKIKKANI